MAFSTQGLSWPSCALEPFSLKGVESLSSVVELLICGSSLNRGATSGRFSKTYPVSRPNFRAREGIR